MDDIGLHSEMNNYFDRASAGGFPVFLEPEKLSTPLNATPYVTSYRRFKETARHWPGRADLVQRMDECLAKAAELTEVQAILIGGSFVDLRNASPKDIDSLWLYRSRGKESVAVRDVKGLQREFKRVAIDARFIPTDADFIALLKAVSFFSIFYSKRKGDSNVCRGLILLDCIVEI